MLFTLTNQGCILLLCLDCKDMLHVLISHILVVYVVAKFECPRQVVLMESQHHNVCQLHNLYDVFDCPPINGTPMVV
jgi:hypothetical protein